MKFTETFEFETTFGNRQRCHEARVTYSVTRGRPQTYAQPAEAPEVDGMEFEIRLGSKWHKAGDDLHDLLLDVIGDDHDWLIQAAMEQALAAADDHADALRQERMEAAG